MTRFAELRKQKNLLQKDLALYIGVDRTTYNKYENGLSEPPFEILKKLADFFEVSIDCLLGYTAKNQEDKLPFITEKEVRLIEAYRILSDEGQFEVDRFLEYAQERYKKDHSISNMEAK